MEIVKWIEVKSRREMIEEGIEIRSKDKEEGERLIRWVLRHGYGEEVEGSDRE